MNTLKVDCLALLMEKVVSPFPSVNETKGNLASKLDQVFQLHKIKEASNA